MGYPFLVGFHAARLGIAKNQKGHYGAGNNYAMMKDVMEHGPATVGIDAPSGMFAYRRGIFDCKQQVRHEGTNLKDLHQWEATNHAVLLYGWGVEKGQPYWLLKNSWGSYWGENGFFRLKRDGSDACAITSMPV